MIVLEKPYKFTPPTNEDYAVMLVIGDKNINEEIQNKISDDIVRSSCVYFMARGYECSSWDDSVDRAAIDQNKFIMTTWHENETVEETLFFLENYVYDHDQNKAIKNKFILFLGCDNQCVEKYKQIITLKNLSKI